MAEPRITYVPRPDATPEGELATLAGVYAFILRCGEERRAEERKKAEGRLPSPDGHDTKGSSRDDFRAKTILHDQRRT